MLDRVKEKYQELNRRHREISQDLNLDALNWNLVILIFFIIIPILLIAFQILVGAYIIQQDVTSKYLILNLSHPNIASMFFTNYLHANKDHLIENLQSYLGCILFIVIFYIGILPIAKNRIPLLPLRFNPRIFILTMLLLFTLVPFSISGISILFGRILNLTVTLGFSGIVTGMVGYLLYLMVKIFYDFNVLQFKERDLSDMDVNSLIFFISFLLIFVTFWLLIGLIDPHTAVFAHLCGFYLGFMLPPLIEIMIDSVRPQQRRFSFFLILSVIAVPALCWLVV